ncbi:uncharacterized protein TNCV_1213791 [Trichonephila clavipes]|nr:uncharacterized protein TNCV_1213791 [Trichonephila clavipes]
MREDYCFPHRPIKQHVVLCSGNNQSDSLESGEWWLQWKKALATQGLLETDLVILNHGQVNRTTPELDPSPSPVAAVAEWYRYRIVACLVTSSSPVPLKTRRVGQRCTLNLSRAETSSHWCGVVVRRGGASSGVVHVT